MAGEIPLRRTDLPLAGHDLDRELSRFDSTQGFDLVDVGAVFLVAHAKDVALATPKHRTAPQGGLDLVRGEFADVTVAVVDDRGCAAVRQELHGAFASPTVEKPRFLRSLAGPVLELYRQTRALLPAGACEAFHSGSVAAPA